MIIYLAILATIADHGDGVVDVLATICVGVVAALLVVVDAAAVVEHVGGHDGGGGGVDVDQLLQLVLVGVPVVVHPSHHGTSVVTGVIIIASSLLGKVRGTTFLIAIMKIMKINISDYLFHKAVVIPDGPVNVGKDKGSITANHGLSIISTIHQMLL